MKYLVLLSAVALSLAGLNAPRVYGQATSTETWNGSASTFNTATAWSPGTIPNSAIFCVFNGNSANRTITISSFRSAANGLRFDSSPNGFTFVCTGTTTSTELAPRPSSTNGKGQDIVNNSGQLVTFNCPVRFYSFGAGTLNASENCLINANSGNFAFNTGALPAGTLNNFALGGNGGTLDFIASLGNTITVGAASTPGIITAGGAGAGGVTKDGAGTLILAGNSANTYGGPTILNAGILTAQKSGAFGTGNTMTLNGGTLQTGGLAQSIGALTLGGNTFVDLSGGTSTLGFANSSTKTWTGGSVLDIENWTGTGSTQVRFGTDATGLSSGQLAQVEVNDNPTTLGSMGLDSNGYLVLVPEPSALALGLLGGLSLLAHRVRRS